MGKSSKGSSFEREICKLLSLWWTKGVDDAVFWRTAGSGARATVRGKKGKRTFGQDGDIQATNPIGQPLIDFCSIELKRGYSSYTIADLLDKPEKAGLQIYESFINQAIEESKNAKSKTWLLITKRDRREALIFISLSFYRQLKSIIEDIDWLPYAKLSFSKPKKHAGFIGVYVTQLKCFLKTVQPEHIEYLMRE